jgi:release factor glutamine methyltransferase
VNAASNQRALDADLLLAATLQGRSGRACTCATISLCKLRSWPIFALKVARRACHEPLAYILGEVEFWSLNFAVSPDVLIPRPDTEVLVEEALVTVQHAPQGTAASRAAKTHLRLKHLPQHSTAAPCGTVGRCR